MLQVMLVGQLRVKRAVELRDDVAAIYDLENVGRLALGA